MRHYYEWDFDQGVVREWRRQGECNNCGDCCRSHIQWVTQAPSAEYKPIDGSYIGTGADHSGVVLEAVDGERRWHLTDLVIGPVGSSVCPLLQTQQDGTGICSRHQDKDAVNNVLTMCALWPIHPAQVAAFERCSYSFVLAGEWKIADIQP